MYCTLDTEAHAFVDLFRQEALTRWEEASKHDTVLNMASAVLLSLGCIGQGKDHVVSEYSSQASSMGLRLGLLAVESSVTKEKMNHMDSEELIMASYTAWGCFNYIM